MAVQLNNSPAEAAAADRANILIVDDLPEKLLVFGTVLEELQQNLVFVRSGAEALREVLAREFAVILLDVNMPDIDGFETATLIRRYKRSAHTPIIFVTAYADEPQTTRGYSLGAVDYIHSPVVPEVLRSKVRVFVELHVLQRRIARQADERVALAASAAALRVAEESTRRSAFLSELSHALAGLLDLRAGMRRLLAHVVPQLAGSASVVLLDSQRQVQHVLRAGPAAEAAQAAAAGGGPPVEALSLGEQARLQAALQSATPAAAATWPPAVPAPGPAYPVHLLQHGELLHGALLVEGPVTPLGDAVFDEVAQRAAAVFAAARLHQDLQAEAAERRAAELRLEEASRRKDEFLAMLSHELRNPLAPIRNAVELIRRMAPHEPKLIWATDVTERQLRQITRLVDELLDVARISQGKIVLQKAPLDLGALILQCLEVQRPTVAARGLVLTQSLPAQPLWVSGDAARLQQVISNLLNNAIKYTQDGGQLHVGLSREGERALIAVRDNGMGIEPALLPRVFDLFEQGQRALDRSQGGLGVGLTLVQRLVRLHEGQVEAFSAGPGLGAEFRVTLPCLALAQPEADAAATAGGLPVGDGRRVLVVDDNADVAESTATMLELFGHQVTMAADGQQALQAVESFRPDVVLLDIGLPGLDGYEVARRLRQRPAGRAALLVALTGYGQAADRQRGREAGFDEHLLKPVDPAQLAELVAQAPRAGAVREASQGGAPAPADDGGTPPPAAEPAPAPPQATAAVYPFRRS